MISQSQSKIIQLHILCGMRDLNFLLSLADSNSWTCVTILSIQFSTWSTILLGVSVRWILVKLLLTGISVLLGRLKLRCTEYGWNLCGLTCSTKVDAGGGSATGRSARPPWTWVRPRPEAGWAAPHLWDLRTTILLGLHCLRKNHISQFWAGNSPQLYLPSDC